jgi:glycolate oxidase iron-sulfur subunit
VRPGVAPAADDADRDHEGLCCGAGGAYALGQPELASAIRARKVAAIARSGAPLVASANPGCALHLAGAGVEAVHPCQLVARRLATRHQRKSMGASSSIVPASAGDRTAASPQGRR